MWFFWWDGRNGCRTGALFFLGMFFLYMFVNMMRGGFFWFMLLGLFIVLAIGAMIGVRELMREFMGEFMNEIQRPSSSRRARDSKSRRARNSESRRARNSESRRAKNSESRRVSVQPPPMPIIVPEEIAQAHALDATILAGINPRKASVLPIDIGVVAYHGDDTTVHRTWRVDARADALQPFINLHLKHFARGRLRFEIRDDAGQMVFFYERDYSLSPGRNLIMPPARMPIDQSTPQSGVWTLRVLGDNLPLAEHRFEWQTDEEAKLETIGADGEISDEMRAILARTRLERMSLDELLGDEGDEQSVKKSNQ